MANGRQIDWNQVNVSLSDPTKGVSTALSGISNAGTIFGDLRKSILDEQQRAVENADREKLFNENVRQFDLNYDQIAKVYDEQIRQFDLNYEEDKRQFGERVAQQNLDRAQNLYIANMDDGTRRYVAGLQHASSMASTNLQRDQFDLALSDRNKQREFNKEWFGTQFENRNIVEPLLQQNPSLQAANNLLSATQQMVPTGVANQALQNLIDANQQQLTSNQQIIQERPFYASGTEMANAARTQFGIQEGFDLAYTPVDPMMQQEQNRLGNLEANEEATRKRIEIDRSNAQNMLTDNKQRAAYAQMANVPKIKDLMDRGLVTASSLAGAINSASEDKQGVLWGAFTPSGLRQLEIDLSSGNEQNNKAYQYLLATNGLPADLPTNTALPTQTTGGTSIAEQNKKTLNIATGQPKLTTADVEGKEIETLISLRDSLKNQNRNIENVISPEVYNAKYQEFLKISVKEYKPNAKSYEDLSADDKSIVDGRAKIKTQDWFQKGNNDDIKTINRQINNLGYLQNKAYQNR